MSNLTMQLGGWKGSKAKAERWRATFAQISLRLFDAYGTPDLGNLRDPVKEIFYIALSAKTTEMLYQRAYRQLITRFKTIDSLATATLTTIAECVECAGLGNKRAQQLQQIATRLQSDFGRGAARALSRMTEVQAFDYLTGLPGIGPKSAFCIMMMSLDVDVFPVDVNVHRIAHRLGALRGGLKHFEAQSILPGLIPDGESKRLHIGMVLHGRRICLPQRPKCGECILLDLCPLGKRKTLKARTAKHEAA